MKNEKYITVLNYKVILQKANQYFSFFTFHFIV